MAREIVLRHLTTQARTRPELERILAGLKVPAEAARTVLDRMNEVGLVDDQAFAQAWVESRQQRRHLSRTALNHELRRKGLDPELIKEATAQVDYDSEHAAALALAHKKLRSLSRADPGVRRRRLAGMLARRGFGSEVVYRVLDELDADICGGADLSGQADQAGYDESPIAGDESSASAEESFTPSG